MLSLVVTSCHAICPTTTRHLAAVVDKARDALGAESFHVAVLGFDAAHDNPRAMAQYAREQAIDDATWQVWSADEETVAGLAGELGFKFFTSPNGFDHIVQATVIDGEGSVYRQVYGEAFATPLMIEPLMELVLNRPRPESSLFDGLVDKVRFFCTAYDPARDAYFFDYSLFIGIVIGGLIIVLAIMFLLREYLVGRRVRHA
ncbi:MAG: SCO family protein [Proteobacteria bacterium]|nr:MAG: SCO family protein [Pseudomonadota bacterium]